MRNSTIICIAFVCGVLLSSGCAKGPNLVDRIRSGEKVKEVTFGATRNQTWVQVGQVLTDTPSLDCLSRQIALCEEQFAPGRSYEARFVLNSGYTETVIFMVQPDASQFCIGVDFGLFNDPDMFTAVVPPDAPEPLREALLFLAHPDRDPAAKGRMAPPTQKPLHK